MAGISAAVTAARCGLKTALIQDRPVLGGNASKEIRVWLEGANGGANSGYFRETGLIEELKLENLYWNPGGNVEHWNVQLANLVFSQPDLDVYLNTVVTDVQAQEDQITSVTGFTLAAERWTTFCAPFFVDATGDGTVGYWAGAEWRSGRESQAEFGESLAPQEAESYTMGGSMMFLVKDVGYPVEFKRPAWAHHFTEDDLAAFPHHLPKSGLGFSWLEWGGEHNTVHDNEEIKYELWRILYGLWDHLKNAPEHRQKTRNLDLEWVAAIPGKRESRRLVGPYILTEHDIVNQTVFPDGVAYGGWYFDDHHSKGFWEKKFFPPHVHPPGLYTIPLRCLYSVNIHNLFMAGRNISVSHIALGSTRVMLTCSQLGEAVGVAAAKCVHTSQLPSQLTSAHIHEIQQELLQRDHHIPHRRYDDHANLAHKAEVTATSEHPLAVAPHDHPEPEALSDGCIIMFPLRTSELKSVEVLLGGEGESTLDVALWKGDDKQNYFPSEEIVRFTKRFKSITDPQWIRLDFGFQELSAGWYFVELKSPNLQLYCSQHKITGIRLLRYDERPRVINPHSSWFRAEDRGAPCLRVDPEQKVFGAAEVINGYARPAGRPNHWISQDSSFDEPEAVTLSWDDPVTFDTIRLVFDTDLDRHIRNIWLHHQQNAIPSCVRSYRVEVWNGCTWKEIVTVKDNYQRRRIHRVQPEVAECVRLSVTETWGVPYAALYEIGVYYEQ